MDSNPSAAPTHTNPGNRSPHRHSPRAGTHTIHPHAHPLPRLTPLQTRTPLRSLFALTLALAQKNPHTARRCSQLNQTSPRHSSVTRTSLSLAARGHQIFLAIIQYPTIILTYESGGDPHANAAHRYRDGHGAPIHRSPPTCVPLAQALPHPSSRAPAAPSPLQTPMHVTRCPLPHLDGQPTATHSPRTLISALKTHNLHPVAANSIKSPRPAIRCGANSPLGTQPPFSIPYFHPQFPGPPPPPHSTNQRYNDSRTPPYFSRAPILNSLTH